MKYVILKVTIENAGKSYAIYVKSEEREAYEAIGFEVIGEANTVAESKRICKEYGVQRELPSKVCIFFDVKNQTIRRCVGNETADNVNTYIDVYNNLNEYNTFMCNDELTEEELKRLDDGETVDISHII